MIVSPGETIGLLWMTSTCANSAISLPTKPPRSVRVKAVHEQHQFDLVDIKSTAAVYKRKSYKHVFDLFDVLSNFHWLFHLKQRKAVE